MGEIKKIIKMIWNWLRPIFLRMVETLDAHKVIVVIILILIFPTYWFGIRPTLIRKECSTIQKIYGGGYNSEYDKDAERQKQWALGEYIQCRNNNLTEGDKVFVPVRKKPFTRTQYETLSRDQLDHIILDELPGGFFQVYYFDYDGYVIDIGALDKLKENKEKYFQCNFPQDFVPSYISGTFHFVSASDEEYKICLRKHGLKDSQKPTPQEVRKDKVLCYQWYGKECDDPSFNPE